MNRSITTALTSIGITQLLKVPLKYAKTKKWDWSELEETGGMPSSHSAGVTSLATYIALDKGISSADFALSAIFGMIVMYDAMGIRRHAGEIAIEVNELDVKVEKLAKQHQGVYHTEKKKRLKEQLGHLPKEVLVGSILGVAVGLISFSLSRNKKLSW